LRVGVLVWIQERGKRGGIEDVSFAFRILKHVKGCGRTNLGVLILNFEDQVPGQERRQVGSSYGYVVENRRTLIGRVILFEKPIVIQVSESEAGDCTLAFAVVVSKTMKNTYTNSGPIRQNGQFTTSRQRLTTVAWLHCSKVS
jgi:hypothetical protein